MSGESPERIEAVGVIIGIILAVFPSLAIIWSTKYSFLDFIDKLVSMKSVILLLVLASISVLFISCSKDDESAHVSDAEKIVGVWKFTEVVIWDENSKTIASSEVVPSCSGEDTYIFEANGRSAFETHYKDGEVCALTKSRTGDYKYNENTKNIEIHFDTGHEDALMVYKVSETDMWINIGRINVGNEKDMYYHVLAYTKQ